jgi:hypothetical protein
MTRSAVSPLGTMTGDIVAVFEVPHLVGIEADRFANVQLRRAGRLCRRVHGAKVAVGNA